MVKYSVENYQRRKTMFITNDIKYIGVNDRKLDLFESQYDVPNGMAYNSYVIIDEKIAVLDTADRNFTDEWLSNLKSALDGRKPDCLIVQHAEPDHSASIKAYFEAYPEAELLASQKALTFISQFYGELSVKSRAISNGEELSLGKHSLSFVAAPMVHWPEVMVTFDSTDKVLFSADAFGKFGALDADEDWACEARRYYFGIVGKYGAQAQALVKKAKELQPAIICPLHGPVLNENLDYYINLYDIWTSYGVESEGVCICYTSVYGNTEKAVELLAEELKALGCPKVAVNDLARCDMAEAVEDAFRYGKLVLATTTYNAYIFPFMKEFIEHLTEKNYQNRTLGFIENGTWAPMAKKVMSAMFEKSKNITYLENSVTIKSALTDENKTAVKAMAKELV